MIHIFSYAQYNSYLLNYGGNARANIEGDDHIITVVVPSGSSISNSTINVYHPTLYNSTAQNKQVINSIQVVSSSSSFNQVIKYDSFGNAYSELKSIPSISSNFFVQKVYSGYTEVTLDNGFQSSAQFPVTNIPANISLDYCQPTTNIQSNDANISNLAHSLTSSCTKMQDAVQKIAKWVVGSITYTKTTNSNVDMNASLVFSRKTGNCTGYTNLAIAMLRSIGIPARYVSGYIIQYPYSIPFIGSSIPMGAGLPGPHAVYEVYYPDKAEWVMSDPQLTLNFCTTHFVRHRHGSDNCDKRLEFTYVVTGQSPIITDGNMDASITSLTNNYAYKNYTTFQAARQNANLIGVFPGYATGVDDKIEITNGTSNFKTGENVSYSSTFTSSGGNTWPVSRSWNLILYHTNGTYIYASDNSNNSYWNKTTDPILPDYQWLLDANGRIFGEVIVSATLNDGDIVGAKMPLSIERCNGVIVSNQTYTSNTTIVGCYVTMDNINVQNNSALIVDTEMGVTINNNFTVNAGSTFETK